MTSYRCEGSVRGWCGVTHRSAAAAARCCQKDHRICAALPGGNSYSDRRVVTVNEDAAA